jgi:hypothetical protein
MTKDVLLSVLICRGCCCGTQDDVEHDRHLATIRAATIAVGGRVKITNCIGPCDRKNVVVVRTRRHADRWTARYFGAVGDTEVAALTDWLAAGSTHEAEPAELSDVCFTWPIPRPRPPL